MADILQLPLCLYDLQRNQCVLLSLFPEYNVSIDDMLSQWNTFPCHRQYFWIAHYGILLDDHAKLELPTT
jgi:hypothetical protein